MPDNWLVRHTEHVYKVKHRLQAYLSLLSSQRRLSGLGFRIIEQKTVSKGLTNLAAYYYKVISLDGNACEVFEKVYLINQLNSVRREMELFQAVCSSDIAAPKFLGFCYSGSFISLYYTFVKGHSPTKDALAPIMFEICQKIWSVPVPESLNYDSLAFLKRYINKRKFKKIQSGLEAQPQVAAVIKNKKNIFKTITHLPKVLLHGDLHAGNIICTEDRSYLVDWTKWSIAHLGAGLVLSPVDTTSKFYDRYMYSVCENYAGVEICQLKLNVCLFNLANAIKRKQRDFIVEWCNQILQLHTR